MFCVRRSVVILALLAIALHLSAATATSIIPSTAPHGARIAIVGKGLAAADVVVAFSDGGGNPVPATVTSRTATLLEVIVPATAVTAPVHVTNAAGAVATLSFTVAPDPAFTNVTTLAASDKAHDFLKQPSATAVALPTGTIFVADRLHHRVVVVKPSGSVAILAGSGNPGLADGAGSQAQFKEPQGIAVDSARQLVYVADTGNNAIRVVTFAGVVSTLAGGHIGNRDGTGTQASFKQPIGLVIDAAGNLYVADSGNSSIRLVTPAGVVTTIAGGLHDGFADGSAAQALFHQPQGVAVSADAEIYVADTLNNAIRKIANGAVTTVAGNTYPGLVDGSGANAEFNQPSGITLDDAGNLVVADEDSNAIRKVTFGWKGVSVSTIGGGNSNGFVDGAPSAAQFKQPAGIASAGALYVADSMNDALRIIYQTLNASAVYPKRGPLAGGNTVRLFGTGFVAGATQVTVGGVAVTPTFVSSTELLITMPAATAGTVDVTVTTPAGTATLAGAYTYVPPPTIVSITPHKGPIAGGQAVAVVGSNFLDSGDTDVTIAGNDAIDTTYISPNSVTATTPAGPAGPADVFVTTPGGSASLAHGYIYFPPPVFTSFVPAKGFAGTAVTLSGQYFDDDPTGDSVTFNGTATVITSASSTQIGTVVPDQATTGKISITTAGGTVVSAQDFVVPVLTAISVAPATPTIDPGKTQQFSATGTYSDGSTRDQTSLVTWTSSNTSVATIAAGGLATTFGTGSTTITATLGTIAGTATLKVQPSVSLPPDPASVATPIDRTVATSFADSIAFLYAGNPPIQQGVQPGAIDTRRIAVVRGGVTTRDGNPLAGVRVSVLSGQQLGWTLTRTDGRFDLAVNGGGVVVIAFERTGYLTVQRQVSPLWNEFVEASPVVMIPLDTNVTTIASGSPNLQTARGSRTSDARGTRRATLMFQAGTAASMILPDGTSRPLATMNVRATEYTVGTNGPSAMPADLPQQSAYTYCVELSTDEAIAAGASSVRFTRPVSLYIDNFIGFDVGSSVPVGYYDRPQGVWIAMQNGIVLKIVSVTSGLADLDLTGNGTPAAASALAAYGITSDERQQLAALYPVGTSLWRVTTDHFTPVDPNWSSRLALPDAEAPGDDMGPTADVNPDECPTCDGSILETESQTLGEAVPITGTPFQLQYRSSRVAGRSGVRTVEIGLAGTSLPPLLSRIDLTIRVAGQVYKQSFSPSPNLNTSYTWNGLDAYGRVLQGSQRLTATIAYVYPVLYADPPVFGTAPGQITPKPGGEISVSHDYSVWLRQWDQRAVGLGGWSLDVHDMLDPSGSVVYRGNGTKLSADEGVGLVKAFLGAGFCDGYLYPFQQGYSGYGCGAYPPNNIATSVRIERPSGIAVAADGSVYVAADYRVYKVDPTGHAFIFAGTGTPPLDPYTGAPDPTENGDGGPATLAAFSGAHHVAVGTDGSVYVADDRDSVIRKIDPTGIINTIAGQPGTTGYSGDGGPAVNATLPNPTHLGLASDGSLYFLDSGNSVVRRIGTDGNILTVAGMASAPWGTQPVNDVPATQSVISADSLAVAADGTLYLADYHSVRRVDPQGMIHDFYTLGCCSATFAFQYGTYVSVAVGQRGDLFVSGSGQYITVLRFAADGTVTMVAKGPHVSPQQLFGQVYAPYDLGNGGGAIITQQGGGPNYGGVGSIAIAQDGSLLIADGANQEVRRVALPMGIGSGSNTVIPSPDGQTASVFDAKGRILQRSDAVSGTTLQTFAYDSAGHLSSITDASGNTTVIQHDAAGNPTAIVAPGGQTTKLSTDANGYLATITDPANQTITLSNTTDGLLTSLTDAKSQTHQFSYAPDGRLLTDSDPTGAQQQLAITQNGHNYSLALTSAMGRTSTFSRTFQSGGDQVRTSTDTAGLTTTMTVGIGGNRTTTFPNGITTISMPTADVRFGMQSPTQSLLTITPGGIRSTVAESRSVVLTSPTDPLTLKSMTDIVKVNGRPYTSTYTAATRTAVDRTPLGRSTTTTVDGFDRIAQVQVPGLASATFGYDSRGRLTSTAFGTRTSSFQYDDANRLTAVIDPLSRTTRFAYDAADRVTSETLPDGRIVGFTYDANGNLTSVTPPSRPAHTFAFTAADLFTAYTPPLSPLTQYSYNQDHQLTSIARPDQTTVGFGYDSAGRLQSVTTPAGNYSYAYDTSRGTLSSATAPDGGELAYQYDGSLLTSETWTGAVSGSITRSYDNDFRVVNENGISFGYDADSLLTSAGALRLQRDPQNGLVIGTTLGNVSDSWGYDSFGNPVAYDGTFSSSAGASPLLSSRYSRDSAGRITQKTETVLGTTSVTAYTYDVAGRLSTVTHDASSVTTYAYDDNGNRLTKTTSFGSESGTYDAEDRLLTWGGATYTYTPNGELASKTDANGTTTYGYDGLGNLQHVALPDGRVIDYVIDAAGRRIGKKINGTLVKGWLYSGQLRIVAETDGTGAIVSQFVYGTRANIPDYMSKSGVTYRIISDHLGSPRVVLDSATGTVVWNNSYDGYGTPVPGTPEFIPFGFAGGLYDADTKLIHFGAREYDSLTGRWTSKDPLIFHGGDTNLFGYALNDPINLADADGLATLPSDPSGLGPEWQLDPNHQDPNGERFRDPEGNVLDWHPAHGGTGWKDQDHWHYRPGGKGGKKHLKPGDEIPDSASSCTIHRDWHRYFDRQWWENTTGLTGWALAAYLLISEGSRLYPPRDLVPIP